MCALPAEFDRRFFTFEVTAEEAAESKARFQRLRPKNAPLVSRAAAEFNQRLGVQPLNEMLSRVRIGSAVLQWKRWGS